MGYINIKKGCFYRYINDNNDKIFLAIGKKQLLEYNLNYGDGLFYQKYCAKPFKYDLLDRKYLTKVDTRTERIGD